MDEEFKSDPAAFIAELNAVERRRERKTGGRKKRQAKSSGLPDRRRLREKKAPPRTLKSIRLRIDLLERVEAELGRLPHGSKTAFWERAAEAELARMGVVESEDA